MRPALYVQFVTIVVWVLQKVGRHFEEGGSDATLL